MKTKKEPLTENEFINLDDELYSMINKRQPIKREL